MLLLLKGNNYSWRSLFKDLRMPSHKDTNRKKGIKGIKSSPPSKNIAISQYLLNVSKSSIVTSPSVHHHSSSFLHFLRKTFHKDKSRKTGIKGIKSNPNSKNIAISHHLLNTGTSI